MLPLKPPQRIWNADGCDILSDKFISAANFFASFAEIIPIPSVKQRLRKRPPTDSSVSWSDISTN
jgi:hypothetical protein